MSEKKYETGVLESRRFALLILLSLTLFTFYFQINEYASNGKVVTDFYGISYIYVNLTSILWNLFTALCLYPTTKFIERRGFRKPFLFALLLNSIGAVIKCISNEPQLFWLLFGSQCFVSSVTLMAYSLCPVFAASWFPPNQIGAVIATLNAAAISGAMVTFIIPLFFNGITDTNQVSKIYMYKSIVVAASSILLLVIVWFTAKDKPKTPPDVSEKKRIESNRHYPISTLLKNKNAIYLLICRMCTLIFNTVIGVSLNQTLLSIFESNSLILTAAGIAFMAFMICGTIIIGLVLKRSRRFQLFHISFVLSCGVFSILYIISLWIGNFPLLIISISCIGLIVGVLFTLQIDYLLEVSYPFPSGTTFAIMITVGSLFCVGAVPLISALISAYGASNANLLLFVFALVQIVFAFLVKEDLRRQKASATEQIDPLEI